MPDSVRVPITDQALPSSTSGQVLVSQGPTDAPVATDTFSTAKTFAAPVTHEAQRQVTGWTSGTNFPSGAFHSIIVGDGYNPDIHWAVSTQPQSDYPANPRPDVISYWGHNVSGNGNPVDPTHPCWGIGLESYWQQLSPTVGQFEGHLQFVSTDGQTIRSWSAAVLQDGSGSYLNFNADRIEIDNHAGTQELLWTWPTMAILGSNAFAHAGNNVQWLTQYKTVGTPAISIAYVNASNQVAIAQADTDTVISKDLLITGYPMTVGAGTVLRVQTIGSVSSSDYLVTEYGVIVGGTLFVGSSQTDYWTQNGNGTLQTASNLQIGAQATVNRDQSANAGNTALRIRPSSGQTGYLVGGENGSGTVIGGIGPNGELLVGNGTQVKSILSATATLDFPSTAAQSSSDLTIAVTGANVGDAVSLGLPASPNANTSFSAWVSASGVVTVRFSNYSSGAVDPASGTYRATVVSF